jgi:hypothetical protein
MEELARDLVNLPADRDALHLHAQRCDDAGAKIEAEILVAKQVEATQAGPLANGLSSLV